MKRSNKKGFTLVELVIVVAVIAILAAVLIPTIAGVVKKANMSADQQAISAMNEYLAIAEADEAPANFDEVKAILAENKVDIDNYNALADGMTFYWVQDLNRIVYFDNEKDEIVFPKEYAGRKYVMATDAGKWISLGGEVGEEKYTVSNGTVEIATAEQLVKLMNDYAPARNSDVTKVVLTADIDMKGAAANFGKIENKNLEIDGDGHKIYGIRNQFAAYGKDNSNYGFGGLIGSVNAGANVIIKDLEIVDAYVSAKGLEDAKHAGILVGNITDSNNGQSSVKGKLTIESVKISGGYVHASSNVGALVGYVEAFEPNTLVVTNVTVSNVKVEGGERTAALIGVINENGSIGNNSTLETISFTNVTTSGITVTHDTSYGVVIAADGKTAGGVGVVTNMDCWFFERNQKQTSVATDIQ